MRGAAFALLLFPSVSLAQGYQVDLYECENGGAATAVYPLESEDVIVTVDGHTSVLRHSMSGSGVRFTPPEFMPGYVWWIKGDAAMVNAIDSDSGEEFTLYSACRLIESRTEFND